MKGINRLRGNSNQELKNKINPNDANSDEAKLKDDFISNPKGFY